MISKSAVPDQQPWIDSRTAAAHLGSLHYKTVERYARAGKLPGYFRFNRWFFLKSELDAFIKGALSFGSQSVRLN